MLQGVHDPNEQRQRVRGKILIHGVAQSLWIELDAIVQLDGGHSGATIGTGHLHAEDRRLLHRVVVFDRGLHLGGGHILTLPPEGVAEPITERRMTPAEVAHQIACVEPGVALLEGVTHQLLLRGRRVGVPVERRQVGHLAQQQSRLPRPDLGQETLVVTYRFTTLDVVLDVRDGHRTDAHGAVDIERVDKCGVRLAGRVELTDPLDPESRGEFAPQLRPQAVTDDDAHPVFAIGGLRRLIEQITAQFSDVNESRCTTGNHLVPEPRHRERPADRQGSSGIDGGGHGQGQRVVVIQRQAAVQHIVRPQPQRHVADTRHTPQPAVVRHHAGLGQAGGARGENVERAILGHHRFGGTRIGGGRQNRHPVQLVDGQLRDHIDAGFADGFLELRLGDQ
ncbi:Uncharacterised protein [Mycobacteroides abscessus subsp. abscessus]|nr:Uncharacterised protein [Mycobacteroides abscessus subsp. abscessus]